MHFLPQGDLPSKIFPSRSTHWHNGHLFEHDCLSVSSTECASIVRVVAFVGAIYAAHPQSQACHALVQDCANCASGPTLWSRVNKHAFCKVGYVLDTRAIIRVGDAFKLVFKATRAGEHGRVVTR
eukprot:2220450-Pyramimonas_sp.AAC.1